MFEIKYEIFEDDISELRNIDLQVFKKEFNEIYGCFTILVNGKEFIPYPSSNSRLETKRIFSQAIITQFNLLATAHFELKRGNYAALKYIENPWTWLEFVRNDDELIVSELKINLANVQAIQTNKDIFIKASKGNIINERILWGQFEDELCNKTEELLKELGVTNKNILGAPIFKEVVNFSKNR